MASSSKRCAGRKKKAKTDQRDSIHVSRFTDALTFEDFGRCCKSRIVIVERESDISLLEKINFKFLNNLIEWNWWSLIDMHQNILINAVRAF